MTIKDRKEREKEEMRELILGAASEIVAAEGLESLSVRKIASRIEYSPAIIYHYFKDKDDIVANLMKRGYQKILQALAAVQIPSATPEERLKEMSRSYIQAALCMPDEYKAVQLNTSPEVLEYTASLYEGASMKKPALAMLYQGLKDIYKDKQVEDSILELTAQIIATSTFGLVMKLILEKELPQEQKDRLIDHHIRLTIDGMVLGKPLRQGL